MKEYSKTIIGSDDYPGAPYVVLLHGWGANKFDLTGISRELNLSVNWRFIQAPISLGNGAGAWFPRDLSIFEKMDPLVYFDNLPLSIWDECKIINCYCIEQLSTNLPEGSDIILGGFSQGAIVSLILSVLDMLPYRILGTICMSPTCIEGISEIMKNKTSVTGPLFISHGTYDPILKFTSTEKLLTVLSLNQLSVSFHPFSGEHEIPGEIVQKLEKFISQFI